jgi:hypothetical protein
MVTRAKPKGATGSPLWVPLGWDMSSPSSFSAKDEAVWRDWLVRGRPPRAVIHLVFRRFLSHLPGAARCKVCGRPFDGVGKVLALFGLGPSRKNPHICAF